MSNDNSPSMAEIVAALRCQPRDGTECDDCRYAGTFDGCDTSKIMRDAAAMLEAKDAQFAALTVELAAAIADVPHVCRTCKHKPVETKGGVGVCGLGCTVSGISIKYADRCNWEWSGQQEAREDGG